MTHTDFITYFTQFGMLGATVLVSLASVVGFMKLFGEKWLENKFQKQLQDHKLKCDTELARLRVEIDTELNKKLKLQEKEFDVLQEVWHKLDAAYVRIQVYTKTNEKPPEETDSSVESVVLNFKNYAIRNKIYLENGLNGKLKKAYDKMLEIDLVMQFFYSGAFGIEDRNRAQTDFDSFLTPLCLEISDDIHKSLRTPLAKA